MVQNYSEIGPVSAMKEADGGDRATVRRLLDRFKRMQDQRRVWDSHWEDLATYLYPNRKGFTGAEMAGDRRNDPLFDSTPIQARRGLASAIGAMTRPNDQNWFSVRAADETLAGLDPVMAWQDLASRVLRTAIYDHRARFEQATGEVDNDLVTFGTGVLMISENVRDAHLEFRAYDLKDCYLDQDDMGVVDTIYRRIRMSARRAVAAFGLDAVGDKVREALEQPRGGADTEFTFLHVVEPVAPDRPGRNRFDSVWVDVDSEHLISRGGFREFPYAVPRFDTAAGDVYGRSPGMVALPDAQVLNQITKTLLQAGQKAVDPPLFAANQSIIGQAKLFPGGITYFNPDAGRGGRPIEPLITGANIPLGIEYQRDYRDQIFAAFFRNVLQLPTAGPQMTATEVTQRQQEFLRVMGPTFGRLQADYVGPVVNRVFAILADPERAAALPPAPDILQGESIDFQLESPVQSAARLIEGAAVRQTMQDVTPLMQLDPNIARNFDLDRTARMIAASNNFPHKLLRPEADVTRERQMEEQQAQAAQQALATQQSAQQVGAVTDVARNVAGAVPEMAEAAPGLAGLAAALGGGDPASAGAAMGAIVPGAGGAGPLPGQGGGPGPGGGPAAGPIPGPIPGLPAAAGNGGAP